MVDVTVITVTRGRPNLLKRAIRSVQKQKFGGTIKHMIIIDDDILTKKFLENLPKTSNLNWLSVPNRTKEKGTPHLAKLRNLGVKITTGKWICFLDDDNEFIDNHISELVSYAVEHGFRAVHSHQILLNRDGTPFLGDYYPWIPDPDKAKVVYKKLCSEGVFTPGSCVVKDRADPIDKPDHVQTVDAGEWLLARELLSEVPFREEYSDEDLENNVGDDDKLLWDLVVRKEPIGCTNKPTLIYYLGGYSNNFSKSKSSQKVMK